MKKLNYLLLGMAGLAMVACSNDDLQGPGASGDGNVQITVSLPGDAQTRADFGSGTSSKVLNYAVYDMSDSDNPVLSFQGTANFGESLSTTLNLNLLDKEYKIAFFAQSETSKNEEVYTFSAPAGAAPSISVNYENMTSANNLADAYDCFYNTCTIDFSSDTSSPSSPNQSVMLYRPVAQLNWGTNDIGKTQYLTDTFGATGQYIMTSLDVSEETPLPLSLDLFAGTTSGGFSGSIGLSDAEANEFQIPASTQVYPVSSYKYVAIQYILVGAPQEISGTTTGGALYNLTLNIDNSGETEEGDAAATDYTTDVVVVNAPLQANYQTNIYGSLLSNNTTFDITVSPGFAGTNEVDTDGAEVKVSEDGIITCITPKLPAGVTVKSMQDNNAGAVAINDEGQPVYIPNNYLDINTALQSYSEIYFAPNITITTKSHQMTIPAGNVTIHGNGATITGGEQDFSVERAYEPGSTVNLTIYNLNDMKVWGAPTGDDVTLNINLNTCTMIGTGLEDGASLVMVRGADSNKPHVNLTLTDCFVKDVQVGIHTSYVADIVVKNCKFETVGIPINYAKKLPQDASVTVSGCTFNKCGIPEPLDAYNYSAPVRVVDNAGPSYSINLLVDNCTFTNTDSYKGYDILLWDYRTDKVRESYPVELSVVNCTPADLNISTIKEPITMGPGYPDPNNPNN